MSNLKLTSIRVSTEALDCAHALSKQLGYYNPSDVLRLAMWIGFKVANPSNVSALFHLMWEDEAGMHAINVDDVLRTAGGLKDEHKG